MIPVDGFFWFVFVLIPLVFLQRYLHREIQAVALIVTRDPRFTIVIFQILFFPGVLLHEGSHFLMAKLLRVRTGRFSVIPRSLPDGRLQLGFVETAKSDIVRDSLIGAAPLIFGTIFVAFVAVYKLDMRVLWDTFRNGQFSLFWLGLQYLPHVKDFYLWAYLAFVVSSTMMPSESDRHAWLELVISVGILFVIALLIGVGPWVVETIAPFVNNFLSSVAVILGLSVVSHMILILPVYVLHRLFVSITGLDVV